MGTPNTLAIIVMARQLGARVSYETKSSLVHFLFGTNSMAIAFHLPLFKTTSWPRCNDLREAKLDIFCCINICYLYTCPNSYTVPRRDCIKLWNHNLSLNYISTAREATHFKSRERCPGQIDMSHSAAQVACRQQKGIPPPS